MISEASSAIGTPPESPTRVPVERLKLDHQNPRLWGVGEDTTDAEVIAELYRSQDLGELLESIAGNGYLDIEPLIVLNESNRLVVLEGNRRLAAILLFREPGLAAHVSEVGQVRITLPPLSEEFRRTLDEVSVYRVKSRADARPFIGFKHINGAAKWESYAKGKFAADWYRDGEVPLENIAKRIGDRHDTVKRMVNAIYVLEQAQVENSFSIEDRFSGRFNFSHLYTALARPPYMEFLGLPSSWSRYDPSPNPVPREHLEQLKEVLRWLYGSRDDGVLPIVQSQNPHIKQLGEVLSSPEALMELRSTGSLPQAHSSIQPAEQKFSEALMRARQSLREASNSLRGFDGQNLTLVDIAEDVSETAQAVHERMKKKVRDSMMGEE